MHRTVPTAKVIQPKMSVLLRLRTSRLFLSLSSKSAAVSTFCKSLGAHFYFLTEELLRSRMLCLCELHTLPILFFML